MKHALLVALATFPFSIKTMDTFHNTGNQGITTHNQQLQSLYSKTFHTLCDLQLNKKNPENVANLISIINQVDILKSAQPPITEQEIGFSIYTKKLAPEFIDYFKRGLQSTINPILASLFFARLKKYNETIKEKNVISPNAQQMANYLHELQIKKLVTQAQKNNFSIPQTTINEVTIATPKSCAVEEFKKLMDDIKAIFNYPSSTIEPLAKLIYHEELKKCS